MVEHVVQERNGRGSMTGPGAVEVHRHGDLGFFRLPLHRGRSRCDTEWNNGVILSRWVVTGPRMGNREVTRRCERTRERNGGDEDDTSKGPKTYTYPQPWRPRNGIGAQGAISQGAIRYHDAHLRRYEYTKKRVT